MKLHRDRLLNLRIMEEITADTYAAKDTELRDRLANLELQLQVQGRGRDEHGDLAIKVFELSQALKEKWLMAESQEKRQWLEIVCLNLTLQAENIVFLMRKPFDVLTKELISPDNRGDRTTIEHFAASCYVGTLGGVWGGWRGGQAAKTANGA